MSEIDKKWLKAFWPVAVWIVVYSVTLGIFVPGWMAGLNLGALLLMLFVSGRQLV